ncbi:MAG: porin family protein [Anditalea sp.]
MEFKNLFIALIAFFAIGTLSAQEFSVGPKIGVSQGNIAVDGDGFSQGDSKLGYHFGLFARLGGNAIYLQPEVLYTNTGGEFMETQPPGADEVKYEATFNRLDVPILVGLKLANFFRVQAGPVASFLLNSEVAQDVTSGALPDYKNSTIGYHAGIGVDVGNMILDLKYEGPFGKNAESIVGFNTDQRQNQLILSLGIRLF